MILQVPTSKELYLIVDSSIAFLYGLSRLNKYIIIKQRKSMPFDLFTDKIDYGEVVFSWDFSEFTKHERSLLWYALSVLVVLGLLIFALVSGNVLFAIIIILASIIIIHISRHEPRIMNIKITKEGIVIENRFYPFSEIKNFWIIHEPDVKRLYFEFKSALIPRLSIPYQEQDPNQLREFLLEYIEENDEREGEPISEAVARWLKL